MKQKQDKELTEKKEPTDKHVSLLGRNISRSQTSGFLNFRYFWPFSTSAMPDFTLNLQQQTSLANVYKTFI